MQTQGRVGLVGKSNISFIAALNNSTAIKVDGEGEVKVTFQVPSDQLPQVMKLVLYVDRTFRVNIEED